MRTRSPCMKALTVCFCRHNFNASYYSHSKGLLDEIISSTNFKVCAVYWLPARPPTHWFPRSAC